MYDSSSFFAAAASRLSSSARRSRSITARDACKHTNKALVTKYFITLADHAGQLPQHNAAPCRHPQQNSRLQIGRW